jgi:hypothetical protein
LQGYKPKHTLIRYFLYFYHYTIEKLLNYKIIGKYTCYYFGVEELVCFYYKKSKSWIFLGFDGTRKVFKENEKAELEKYAIGFFDNFPNTRGVISNKKISLELILELLQESDN